MQQFAMAPNTGINLPHCSQKHADYCPDIFSRHTAPQASHRSGLVPLPKHSPDGRVFAQHTRLLPPAGAETAERRVAAVEDRALREAEEHLFQLAAPPRGLERRRVQLALPEEDDVHGDSSVPRRRVAKRKPLGGLSVAVGAVPHAAAVPRRARGAGRGARGVGRAVRRGRRRACACDGVPAAEAGVGAGAPGGGRTAAVGAARQREPVSQRQEELHGHRHYRERRHRRAP